MPNGEDRKLWEAAAALEPQSFLERLLYQLIERGDITHAEAADIADYIMFQTQLRRWNTAHQIYDAVLEQVEALTTQKGKEAEAAKYAEAREMEEEAVRTRRALAGMAELGKPLPKEEWTLPSMPPTEKIAKAFLEETGLGAGTRLRSFLEQEFIPEVIGETRAAREAWWKRMHPEPRREEDGAREIGMLKREAEGWARIASGEGGLKGMAERAYERLQEGLAEKVPAQRQAARGVEYLGGREAYEARHGELTGEERRALVEAGMEAGYGAPPAPKPGEDPLIAALRAKKFRPEYYRKPGTGLVSRLTPAVRY